MSVLLTKEDAVVLLIDHQVGVMDWVVKSPPTDLVKANVVKLARAADILGIPLLLSTNQEDVNGPLIPELEEIAETAAERRVKRSGTVDALADPEFAARLEDTGRRSLILAGIGSDVCAVFPTLHALGDGYRVDVVADACGTTSEFSHEIALRRMEEAGARLVTTASILAELAVNFATSPGRDVLGVMQASHRCRADGGRAPRRPSFRCEGCLPASATLQRRSPVPAPMAASRPRPLTR